MEFVAHLIFVIIISVVWSLLRSGWRKFNEPSDTLRKAEQDADYVRKDNYLSPEDAELYKDNQRLGVAFSRLALAVALSDGPLSPRKYAAILSFFEGADQSYLRFISQSIKRDLQNPSRIDWNYSTQVMKELLTKERFRGLDGIVFDGLVRLSAAEGHVSPSAMITLYNLMKGLGWSEEKTKGYFQSRFGHHDSESEGPEQQESAALSVLGLSSGASTEEIRKRYRELAKTHHPDVYASMGGEMQASANNRFAAITEAYETLMTQRSA